MKWIEVHRNLIMKERCEKKENGRERERAILMRKDDMHGQI